MFARKAAASPPQIALRPQPAEAPLWLQRLSLVLQVAVCVYLGIWLVVLPWTSLWSDNPLLLHLPAELALWLQTGVARGIISGLGLLDVWIGIYEVSAFQARRRPRS